MILDNQPRNKEVIKLYNRMALKEYSIFVWPEEFSQYKDLNELVMSGNMSKIKLKDFIKENTFKGLELQLRLSKWNKL